MKPVLIAAGVGVLFLAIATIAAAIHICNGLITKDEAVNEGWAEVDNQLKRRLDLVPNLVATVRGYASHEKEVFTAVADARSRLLAARGPADAAGADAALNVAIGRLLAISESYPALKADGAFIRLQDELAGTENRLAVARQRYNAAARTYNTAIRSFPGRLFAGTMRRQRAEYYEAPEGREQLERVPQVQFP